MAKKKVVKKKKTVKVVCSVAGKLMHSKKKVNRKKGGRKLASKQCK